MGNKEKGDGEEEETQGEEWLTKRERIDGTGRKVREEEVTERKVAEKWKLEMMRVLLRQRERERERERESELKEIEIGMQREKNDLERWLFTRQTDRAILEYTSLMATGTHNLLAPRQKQAETAQLVPTFRLSS